MERRLPSDLEAVAGHGPGRPDVIATTIFHPPVRGRTGRRFRRHRGQTKPVSRRAPKLPGFQVPVPNRGICCLHNEIEPFGNLLAVTVLLGKLFQLVDTLLKLTDAFDQLRFALARDVHAGFGHDVSTFGRSTSGLKD